MSITRRLSAFGVRRACGFRSDAAASAEAHQRCDTPVTAAYRNHVWAIDFQHDHLEDGSAFKIASILDEHTRASLDDTVDTSITGEDLTAILDSIALEHGFLSSYAWTTDPR